MGTMSEYRAIRIIPIAEASKIKNDLKEENMSKRQSTKLNNKNIPINDRQESKESVSRNTSKNSSKSKNKSNLIRKSAKKYSKNSAKPYKRYKCPHCDYSTDVNPKMIQHIRIHTGEKPFVCTFDGCNKRFAQKSNLNVHIKRHVGIKEHNCSHCGKEFVEKKSLRAHLLTHTGDRPYECKHCKMRFKRKGGKYGLTYHIKSMHKK